MHQQFLIFNNCTLCPHCIYVFCINLRTNSDLCHLQYKLIGFYNRDEKCLQRGTDWVFKYHSLRFVFKGLIQYAVCYILMQSAPCLMFVSLFIYQHIRSALCIPSHMSVVALTRFGGNWHHLQRAQSSCKFFATHDLQEIKKNMLLKQRPSRPHSACAWFSTSVF